MIKVSSTEKSSIPADQMTASFNVSSSDVNYQKTLEHLNLKTKSLFNDLRTLSFENKVNVSSYSIRKIYDKNNEFTNYRGTSIIKLESSYTQENILEVINLLNSSKSSPTFTFTFTNSNIPTFRNSLINSAYNGAKVKADILAKSSNQVIKGISETTIRDYNIPVPLRMYNEAQYVPQEIDVQITVDVVYET